MNINVHDKEYMSEDWRELKELQKNLARDLVSLEENEDVSEETLEQVTELYTRIYNIIADIKRFL